MVSLQQTSYQVIRDLIVRIPDAVRRRTAEGLVVVASPLEYELIRNSPLREIDIRYMKDISLTIAGDLQTLEPDSLDQSIQQARDILSGLPLQRRRIRHGFDDIYPQAYALAQRINKRYEVSRIGTAIEDRLPLFYRHVGLGDGRQIMPRNFGEALKQEYLFYCRLLKRLR